MAHIGGMHEGTKPELEGVELRNARNVSSKDLVKRSKWALPLRRGLAEFVVKRLLQYVWSCRGEFVGLEYVHMSVDASRLRNRN